MTTLTQNPLPGAFLKSELPGTLSRDTVTILVGQNLKAGAVLGKVTASGKYRAHNPDGVDGSETAAAILYAPVDASDADVAGAVVINFGAEVITDALQWAEGVDANEKAAALVELRTLQIKAR